MESYDIIIIGSGLSGLMAAKTLSQAGARILVVEKNGKIGYKNWPAGTFRDMTNFRFPEDLLRKYHSFQIHTPNNMLNLRHKGLTFYNIKRTMLENWLAEKVKQSGIEIKLNSFVTEIKHDYVVLGQEKINFNYLIGADGHNSIVRKYLGLPSEAKNIVCFHEIPTISPNIQIHLSPKYYGTGYAFLIPNGEFSYIGCGVDLRERNAKQVIEGFRRWLKINKIKTYESKLSYGVMNHDFRGYQFGNIFLIGDAGGFALGLTGEGIYPALLSGQEIAKKILNPNYKPENLNDLIKRKGRQSKIRNVLSKSITINKIFVEAFINLMKFDFLNQKIFTSL